MANEHAVAGLVVAIEREVTASAARDYDFTEVGLGGTADERMDFDDRDSRKDQLDGLVRRRRITIDEE